MIICTCRNISDKDFDSEEELRERIMMDDFNCGQCQNKYYLENSLKKDLLEIESIPDSSSLVDSFLKQKSVT